MKYLFLARETLQRNDKLTTEKGVIYIGDVLLPHKKKD